VEGELLEKGFDGGETLVLLAGGDFEDRGVGGEAGEEGWAVETKYLGGGDDEGALAAGGEVAGQECVEAAADGGKEVRADGDVVGGGGGADGDGEGGHC
jgi:hypothetical protein